MVLEGPTPTHPRSAATWRLRGPLTASIALHALALGAALWIAASPSPAPRVVRVGALSLRPPDTEPRVEPDLDLEDLPVLETPDVEATLDLLPSPETPDDLPPPDEFERPQADEPVPTWDDVPLRAARGRRTPPPPPQPPTPTPPRPPTVLPRRVPPVLRVRPPRPPPPPAPPRAAPSTAPRAPLRVVWAPDPRRFYPRDALRRGLGGRTLVRLTIDARGLVLDARVAVTSGSRLLDDAAVALARRYRFTTGNGLRTTRLPVTFRPPAGGGL